MLAKEKAATRASDKLAAERRRLPMVRIEKNYTFQGPDGNATLADFFDGRRQLILYHFMFAPGVGGWPAAGCPGCSMVIDNLGHPAHLRARDTSFVMVSLAPFAKLAAYKKRMGWSQPWYSSAGSDFNADFGLSTSEGETYGLSVFLRDRNRIFRTYFTDGRGVEALGTNWTLLDLTPFGRQKNGRIRPPESGRPRRLCGGGGTTSIDARLLRES